MLEKQKKWCHEKVEKGKKWVIRNQRAICFGFGAATAVGVGLILEKCIEPKEVMIQTGTNTELEAGNFMIRVAGEDRFGKESYHSPWVRYECGDEDKERINKAITAAINRDDAGEF